MAIQPPTNRNGEPIKEKQCLYGPPGIGKTHQYFTIAKWHQDLGSDAVFYGINTDTSYEVLHSNPGFSELDNLVYEQAFDFQDFMNLTRQYKDKMRPQDWLSVDLHNAAWAAAQDEYARNLVDKRGEQKFDDLGEMWVAEGGTDYPIKGWDWGVINARYRRYANNLLLTLPGNLLLVCGQRQLMDPTDKMKEKEDPTVRRTRETFKHIGYAPEGQKEDPFRYHSYLHIDSRDNDTRKQMMSTAKERFGNRRMWGKKMGNGKVRDEPIEDFFVDYLVNTAGWKMA